MLKDEANKTKTLYLWQHLEAGKPSLSIHFSANFVFSSS